MKTRTRKILGWLLVSPTIFFGSWLVVKIILVDPRFWALVFGIAILVLMFVVGLGFLSPSNLKKDKDNVGTFI